ncbi:hypothetical protein EsDP_00003068 [Epichloe bromicola]|uniref:LrgB-like protein n=1 Tax=Epichloe bromicola TaxID=79588 RepID=A0ABQ0CMQ7_9HYPO
MSDSIVWRSRWNEAIHHFVSVLLISLIYLTSELNIWGLSLALASAQLQYFASILGMALVFSAMTVAGRYLQSCDGLYRRWIKDKVDFINAQLGVGFSVPIIMLDHMLSMRDVGYIVATSVVTNVVSWTGVFFLALAGLSLLSAFQSHVSGFVRRHAAETPISCRQEEKGAALPAAFHPYESQWKYVTSEDSVATADHQSSSSKDHHHQIMGIEPSPTGSSGQHDKSAWYLLKSNGYLSACLVGIIAIGIPLEMALSDSRALDGFTLWLCWIVAVRLQRMVKQAFFLIANVRCRHTLATMINPVLVTTTFMLGYTRLRGFLSQSGSVTNLLESFSSGTPLYSLWTALIRSAPLPDNATYWFGAGDFALSLLECGIVAWGFKLYECRRQLFSISGLAIFFFCSVAAAGNVFLSVLLASALGLDGPEALAFAARSTTLALAKPAVKTLGGNLALNATLVVSNGIIGQLLYPILLEKLSIPASDQSTNKEQDPERDAMTDTPRTVAAGTAIGINGAAMGVSYLYEVNSRAAPYAALSMTIFGVMTVAFTTLEPFKRVVQALSTR